MIVQVSLGMKVIFTRIPEGCSTKLQPLGGCPIFHIIPLRIICKRLIVRYIWNTCQTPLFWGDSLTKWTNRKIFFIGFLSIQISLCTKVRFPLVVLVTIVSKDLKKFQLHGESFYLVIQPFLEIFENVFSSNFQTKDTI